MFYCYVSLAYILLAHEGILSRVREGHSISLKMYSTFSNLEQLNKKYDYYFISTSNGILSSRQFATNPPLGGQLLFGFKLNTF